MKDWEDRLTLKISDLLNHKYEVDWFPVGTFDTHSVYNLLGGMAMARFIWQ
jgi:hypothetical protein